MHLVTPGIMGVLCERCLEIHKGVLIQRFRVVCKHVTRVVQNTQRDDIKRWHFKAIFVFDMLGKKKNSMWSLVTGTPKSSFTESISFPSDSGLSLSTSLFFSLSSFLLDFCRAILDVHSTSNLTLLINPLWQHQWLMTGEIIESGLRETRARRWQAPGRLRPE